KHEFILALVGYSVGLGNVWRFPYLCYDNGGGAFLIPYLIFVLLAGIPLFFLEISLGQFTQQSCIEVWSRLAPSMKGVAYGSAVVNFMCAIYFVIVMSWSVLYLVHSCIPGDLPWTTCGNWWNSEECRVADIRRNVTMLLNTTSCSRSNLTTSPEQEFWSNYVLRQTSGIENMGGLDNWPLILCFIASWVVIYLCVFKGARTSGKVVYVTAIAPYVLLTILLVRGLTLEGAWDGVVYFLKPDLSKLLDSKVWEQAGGQIFYSYGICFTVLYAFGSYNRFNNNCYNLTSVFASLVVFSIIGHMSFVQGKSIECVATEGPGLVFQVYPVGLSLLPVPHLWSVLFFATLFMVGIDTQGGIYVFQLFNNYAVSGIALLWLAFFQSIAIGWVYGVDRYFENVKSMVGYYPSRYFKFCYRFFAP
uniref:Transporter n=1 Tax=Ciona savignyi TaxID=51511 RepID=H2YVB7_CIOSA